MRISLREERRKGERSGEGGIKGEGETGRGKRETSMGKGAIRRVRNGEWKGRARGEF